MLTTLKRLSYLCGCLVFTSLLLLSSGNILSAQSAEPTIPGDATIPDLYLPDVPTSMCGDLTMTPLTAIFGAEKGTYKIYVRLGQEGQNASVTLREESFEQDGACRKVGTAEASGDRWQEIGTWTSKANDEPTTFSLSSSAINGLPDANRPTIMLVPEKNPVCVPAKDCTVTINGRRGVINAAGTLLNEDTLHVVKVIDPSSDTITRVDYYVDSKPVYSKPTIEEFNLRYVGPGKHTLSTVVTYESKQKVVLSETINRGFTDGISYIFYSFVYGQQMLLGLIALSLLAIILWSAFIAIIRLIHKRRLWKKTHINDAPFTVEQPANPTTKAVVIEPTWDNNERPQSVLRKTSKFVTILLCLMAISLTLVLGISSFVFQIYQVDGPSMDTTLSNGQRLGVNRMGKTWSAISKKKFMPKRGDVVVYVKPQNFIFEGSPETYIVKRVVALAGERVVVNKGKITVYNQASPDGFDPDENVKWSGNIQKSSDEQIDLTVAEGQVFVVGDNRPESVDSRSYGPIDTSYIVGSAEFGLFPFSSL